ncbi:hypothetical protein WAX46_13440 [Bacillus sp. FJAT-53060]|uniref:hypothetical protein n=1 Tax=Bacillus sp. FJAT-53060 TaxID=3127666 RepID=UPI00301362E5
MQMEHYATDSKHLLKETLQTMFQEKISITSSKHISVSEGTYSRHSGRKRHYETVIEKIINAHPQ